MSAAVNAPSSKRSHSSLDAGSENLTSHRHTHSPRHLLRGEPSSSHVHERDDDSDKLDRDGVLYPVRWHGNDDSRRIDASGSRRPHTSSCSNGSEHV